MSQNFETAITWILAIVAIAILSLFSYKRFAKLQHLLPAVNKIQGILRDIEDSAYLSMMLPESISEMLRETQQEV